MQFLILMVTWKWVKKNLILFPFFLLHEQLYIKGNLLFRTPKVSVRYLKMLSVPWLVNPSRLRSTGRENALLRSEAKKKNFMHTPQAFLRKKKEKENSHHNTTLVRLLRGNSSTAQDARGRNLSSECCQTWQDAEEWCICLMYLQRNENTITLSLFWARRAPHLLPGLLVIELVQTSLITEVSASIYTLADGFVTLWVFVCMCMRVSVCVWERKRKQEISMNELFWTCKDVYNTKHRHRCETKAHRHTMHV